MTKLKREFHKSILLTEEMILKVGEAIKSVVIMRHVAGLCGVHWTTLYNWIEKGKDDIEKEKFDTIHARLFYTVKVNQSETVQELLEAINAAPERWQAKAWILERCFREDFGADAGAIQELFTTCLKLKQDYDKLASQSMKGSIDHG